MSERNSKLAVITGAASGMGEASAQVMHEQGWQLVLCDMKEDALRASAAAYAPADSIGFVTGDITTPTFTESLDSAIAGRPVDAVIHCAGISPSMAESDRVLEVNLAGSMRLVDHMLPKMTPGSAIVLFASSSGHMPGTAFDDRLEAADTPEKVLELLDMCSHSGIAYTIAKRGVMQYVRREANRCGAKGVRLVSISPGIIDTPMGRQEMQRSPIMKTLVDNSSLARPAEPREVAAVAAFLCSPAASFITGTDILVDGGSLSRGMPGAAA